MTRSGSPITADSRTRATSYLERAAARDPPALRLRRGNLRVHLKAKVGVSPESRKPEPRRSFSAGGPTADSTAVHDNETAALSLFEQPFCSGIQGAKVTVLRVQAIRRIAKFSGPTVGGQRIDRTGDLVTAKHNEERTGADTGGLSARRVALDPLHEFTARHNGRVQTIVTGPAATR